MTRTLKKRRHRSYLFPLLLASLAPFLLTRAAKCQGTTDENKARLNYTRVLQGSTPEYLSLGVDSDGNGVFEGRKLADPPRPRSLKISAVTTRKLFEIAASLNNFRSADLESHKKVANMGEKTFTYTRGTEKNQATFNYTLDRQAQRLVDLFEKIAVAEQHLDILEYAAKYDHLGLPRELLQIQIDLENNALAEPELLVPALDEIAKNPRYMHLAQVRAQNILQQLQSSNN
jgi:hypothetical protein